ncbi:beta-propeller domain-containing protein [Sandaracinus amylolyticus]|uniref:beta-propeller domain-containing protein n=1 Tax=Sandaracinus amylolyticus TaxID=927083 RepID=UPI00069E3358|nr:beta-propeller domain-containing protein [Sandaracinus amylolyticus]
MRGVMRSIALAIVCALVPSCAGGPSSSGAPAAESTSSGGESITNVQEQGVDEGGIVKMHGEHLVVLRRGRLFSVDLAGGSMRQISATNAYAPGHHAADWYDELLIHGDTIVVIGFSYRDSATEIGLFEIDGRGLIAHRGSFQLRSNDYFSSRNYASRLVGDRLVLYVPHYLGYVQGDGSFDRSFPALRAVGGSWSSIEGPVHASLAPRDGYAVLHTVVMCELGQRDALGCRAQGMVGPAGRTFYVSRDAVYVWISDAPHTQEGGVPTDAMVYRLPLDGGATGAVRAWGAPIDQLSFKEADDGRLHVLVRGNGHGDAMWAPEQRAGALALASIPLGAFVSDGRALDVATYRAMPQVDGSGALTNRFVGDWVLYGTGDAWGWGQARGGSVYAASWRHGGPAYRVDLGHDVERIEVMGRGAVVVGRENEGLAFSSIALDGGVQPVDRYVLRNASQGETRTHGFFYRDDGEGQGVLGLPVRGGNESGWHQLWHGSASVFFLRVSAQRFTPLGGLASGDAHLDDHCVASCADWYGNARPIFWRGRVFALLGYELVEGRVVADRVEETARLVLRP